MKCCLTISKSKLTFNEENQIFNSKKKKWMGVKYNSLVMLFAAFATFESCLLSVSIDSKKKKSLLLFEKLCMIFMEFSLFLMRHSIFKQNCQRSTWHRINQLYIAFCNKIYLIHFSLFEAFPFSQNVYFTFSFLICMQMNIVVIHIISFSHIFFIGFVGMPSKCDYFRNFCCLLIFSPQLPPPFIVESILLALIQGIRIRAKINMQNNTSFNINQFEHKHRPWFFAMSFCLRINCYKFITEN